MKKFKSTFQTFSLIVLFLVFAAALSAQSTRTWVSGIGDDVNPCSRSAPCKTFAGTLSKTAMGGIINCLDPAGYSAVTITKSVTIDCEDTQGSILASALTGITINITDPLDIAKTVRIRGISINGAGSGQNGVKILAGNKVVLEEMVIDGFTQHGVSILTSDGALNFVMKDTTVSNNDGNGINTFLSGAATVNVSVDNSLFAYNNIGFNQGLATTSSIQNSAFTNNVTGVQSSGSTSILNVKDCVIAHNYTGLNAVAPTTVRIGFNLITANTVGLSGGTIRSWFDNFIDGNPGGNGLVNGAPAAQQ